MDSIVKVVEINEGKKISWAQNTSKITFGDDELMVNCKAYQRDWPVHLDICLDDNGNLVIGTGTGRYYAAQVDIPAQAYTEPQPIKTEVLDAGDSDMVNQQYTPAEPIPLDMADVTLTLWAIDGLRN